VDEAYYILFGIPAPITVRQRIWRILDSTVLERIRYPYERLLWWWSGLFPAPESNQEYLSVEEAPPGAKESDVFFRASELELYLRRSRANIYHPLLGIEIATYNLDGMYRISPVDLARYLKGETAVEYEIGATHLFNLDDPKGSPQKGDPVGS
jgi:hypothetical protein